MPQSDPITTHNVEGDVLNNNIFIQPIGVPGPGGAFNVYEITPLISVPVPPEDAKEGVTHRRVPLEKASVVLRFQKGNPAEEINGLSNEALLAVVLHRLEGFHLGPFSSDENNEAANHVVKAMNALKERHLKRLARGVNGTQKK